MPFPNPVDLDASAPAYRAERFDQHARAIGFSWAFLGSVDLLIGTLNFRHYLQSIDRSPEESLAFAYAIGSGLAMIVIGIATWRRSKWAIYAGMGLTCLQLVRGIIRFDFLSTAVSTALILLAGRTLLQARGDFGQRPGILRRYLGGSLLARFLAATIGVYVGGILGAVVGLTTGLALTILATLAHLVGSSYGLGLIGGALLGAYGGAAGGAFGGFVRGATLGREGTVRLVVSGGMAAGTLLVGYWVMRDVTPSSWNRPGAWIEAVYTIIVSISTGALGSVAGGMLGGAIARGIDAPVEKYPEVEV